MIKTTVLSFVGVVVLVAAVAAAYFYLYAVPIPTATAPAPVAAQPDNSVMAGSIQSLSDTSITIKKQDGTTATFSIASTTRMVIDGSGSTATTTGLAGKSALITPGAHTAAAQMVVIVSAPPAQPRP